MRTIRNILLATVTICGVVGSINVTAQTVLDGAYIKEHTKTQRVVPYPHIREADVMWYRRIWREIDLREKINHPLYFPIDPINDRKSLFDVIKQSLLVDGSVTAYSAGALLDEDEFKQPLLANQLKDIFIRHDTSQTEDINTGDMKTVIQEVELGTSDIKRYRLKEDWIFDKQRSTMDIRIIGIAPMKEMKGESGEVRGYAPIFWLYFPELRYVLANWEVFNRENDAERRSFDHIFWTRQFNSTIVKRSNVYDRPIAAYKTGIDGLLEGEEIKQDLFTFEHDLWNF